MLPLLLLACNGSGNSSPATGKPAPTMGASVELKAAVMQDGNALRITSPLPGSVVTSTLTVYGEGTAFENTFNVDLIVGGSTVASTVVNTDAPIGVLCAFTATLGFAPVSADTEAELHVYTTSPQDGHVDQSASVPLKLVPESAGRDTGTATTNMAVIHLNPDRGGAGKQVLIVGENFPANTDVEIHLGGLNTGATEHVYATFRSDAGGAIKGTFVMPEYWPNGEKILVSQVVVLANTPDFLYKATAEFNYQSDPASPLSEDNSPE
ncbi:MAG TPA: Gmad2 immunoglobulin-like domain-containing protein [Chloroflexia bacterium]